MTGIVLDAATSDPVRDANVEYEEDAEEAVAVQTSTTDNKGRFEIESGTRGVVTVKAESYGTARRAWPPRDGSSDLRIHMTPPAVVSGTMVDLVTGRAVPGDVTLIVSHPHNLVSESLEVTDGMIRYVDAPPGPAVIFARANGYAPHFGTFTAEGGKDFRLRIGLVLEAAASGTVLDAGGDPVRGAHVIAHYDERVVYGGLFSSLAGGDVDTDGEGRFRIDTLSPDSSIGLQAVLGDQETNVVTVSAGPGHERTGVVLRFP